jgi:hypothetical protein
MLCASPAGSVAAAGGSLVVWGAEGVSRFEN